MTLPNSASKRPQRGGFLLEALVGILIFTFGVLGLVGLQARAIGYVSDAAYRGEAAYLASSYLSRMWADNPATIADNYLSPGQPDYDALRTAVFARLPGASLIADNPSVRIAQPPAGGVLADACAAADLPVDCGLSLTSNGAVVTLSIQWLPPAVDEGSADIRVAGARTPHNYTVSTVIAFN